MLTELLLDSKAQQMQNLYYQGRLRKKEIY